MSKTTRMAPVSVAMFLMALCAGGAISWSSPTVLSSKANATPPTSVHGQRATLLPTGSWLLTGGETEGVPNTSVLVYDPSTQITSSVGALARARAWHSATLLPDGKVLVYGGIGTGRVTLSDAEVFDPATLGTEVLSDLGLTPRAHHTANVLTDGTVLVAGGDSSGTGQVWDPIARTVSNIDNFLVVPRVDATSTLLPSGAVLLAGGASKSSAAEAELYVPESQGFEPAERSSAGALPGNVVTSVPKAVATIPKNGATDVEGLSLIALRFSESLDVRTLSTSSVALVGPRGPEPTKVVPVEEGRLLFVTPIRELAPATVYTLVVRGAQASGGRAVPLTAIEFSTKSKPASVTLAIAPTPRFSVQTTIVPGAVWQPKNADSWTRGRVPNAAAQKLPLPQAAPNVTALAGRVLLQDGSPLAGVTVYIGKVRTVTDTSGRFLLAPLEPGHVQFIVDGRSANSSGTEYGQFVIGTDLIAHTTNALSYTIWMPVIDATHAVNLPSPTTHETDVTSPLLPGVVLKIPAAAVIREPNGQIATRVSLTPIPLDRSPFPTPQFSMYFVIQPGGAIIESANGAQRFGAHLIYPNAHRRPPGAVSQFMYYDPSGAGWTAYGKGHVDPTGHRIEPEEDTRLHGFSGFGDQEAMNPPPPVNPPPNSCGSGGGGNSGAAGTDGDPVDCFTGLFTYSHVDMVVSDTMPIVIKRTYQSSDPTPRNFGVGFSFPYALWLYSTGGAFDTNFSTLSLVLPNGSLIPFTRTAQSSQTGLTGLQMVSSATPTEFNGAIVTYESTGYLVMTTKDGMQYRFNASDGRYLRSITNRNGQTLQVIANSSQLGENSPIVTLSTPNGRWVQIQYTGSVGAYPAGTSQIASITDNSGRSVSYAYDTSGRLTQVTYPNGGLEKFTYIGTTNKIQSVILPNGQTKVTNIYDTNNRVQQQTLADGGIYHFSYTTNGNGQVTQTTVTDPNNDVHVMAFNSAGYVTSSTRAFGTSIQQATTYQRDPTSNLVTSMTDALNRITAYTYDSMGNLKTVTYLSGTANAVTYTYTYTPTFNELATVKDPLNHTTTFGYDNLGELTSVTDGLNHTVATVAYNTATGLPTQFTDALNHSVAFAYQGSNLTTVTDAIGRVTRRYLDSLGRLIVVQDPLGNRTQYTLNSMDRIAKITDPNGNVTGLGYDLDVNLTSVTDPRNGLTQYAYDSKDRLKKRTDPLNQAESFAYDHDDNLISRTDRKSQQQVSTFDALNRVSQIQYKKTSGGVESTIGYTYDAGNRATQIADSAGGTITRAFDGLDRLTSETTSNGTVGYQYDTANRRTQLTVTGQTNPVTYGFDAANRLTGITQGSSGVTIGYDNAGRRTTLTLPNGVNVAYGFDNANQLASLTYTVGSTTIGNLTYAYDGMGRITTRGGTLDATNLPATAVTTTSYNAGNRLTPWGASTLGYDLNGNLTGDGSNTYTWNARDQLTSITGAHSQTAAYDGLGRRKAITVSGTSRTLEYDGLNLVQEGGAVSVNYLTGANVDETYSATTSAGTQSYLADILGSSIALTDTAGTVKTSYKYEPYGTSSATGTTSANVLQYTGRDNDGTGLYYYRARYYSPQWGRFVSEDPIGILGGINAYAYASGNPVGKIDPLGLWSLTVEGYSGFGGGFIIGRDPDSGQFFYGGRLGIGLGVGGSWDPLGKRPGASKACPCGSHGTTVGGYGSLGLTIPAFVQWNPIEFQGGHDFGGGCPDFSEAGPGSPTVGLPGHFELGGAVGIQVIGR